VHLQISVQKVDNICNITKKGRKHKSKTAMYLCTNICYLYDFLYSFFRAPFVQLIYVLVYRSRSLKQEMLTCLVHVSWCDRSYETNYKYNSGWRIAMEHGDNNEVQQTYNSVSYCNISYSIDPHFLSIQSLSLPIFKSTSFPWVRRLEY
jgi:hypothetical protein